MVKVIGFDETVLKTRTCLNCAVIVEYLPGDVNTERKSSMIGEYSIKHITCPNCNKPIQFI